MAKAGDLFVRLLLNDLQYVRGMTKAERQAMRSARIINKSLKGVGTALNNAANMALRLGSALAVIGTSIGMKKVIKDFQDFETSLTDTQKITDESMESIRAKVESISSEFGTSTELVKGYYQVLSAGVRGPVRSLETLTIAAKASKAAHIEQAETVKALTKLLNTGLVKSAKEASDALFAIEKVGQTTFGELVPVIGSLGQLAKSLNVSMGELAGSFSTITQVAGSVEEAATQQRAQFIALLKPSEKLKKVLDEIGFASSAAAIKSLGFQGMLRRINSELGGSETRWAGLIGRQRALIGTLALIRNGFSDFSRNQKLVNDTTDMTNKAFERWKRTLEGLKTTIKNTITNLSKLIGEEVSFRIKDIVDNTNKWVTANQDLIKSGAVKYLNELIDKLEWLIGNGDNVVSVLKSIALAIVAIKLGAATQALFGFTAALKAAGLVVSTLSLNLGIAAVAFGVFLVALEKIKGPANDAKMKLRALTDDMAEFNSEARFGADSLKEFREEMERLDKFKTDPFDAAKRNIKYPYEPGQMAPMSDFFPNEPGQLVEAAKVQANGFFNAFQGEYETQAKRFDPNEFLFKEQRRLEFGIKEPMEETFLEARQVLQAFNADVTKWQEKQADKAAKAAEKGYEISFGQENNAGFQEGIVNAAIEANDRRIELEKDFKSQSISLTQDVENAKIALIQDSNARAIATENIRYEREKQNIIDTYVLESQILELSNQAHAKHLLILQGMNVETTDKIGQGWIQFGNQMSRVLANSAMEADNVFQNIANAFKRMLTVMAAELAAKAVIFSILSAFIPGVGLGGGAAKAGLSFGQQLSQFLGFDKFGSGGMVSKPTMALIGETGPEMVLNPAQTREYVSNSDSSQQVFNINMTPDDFNLQSTAKFGQTLKNFKRENPHEFNRIIKG